MSAILLAALRLFPALVVATLLAILLPRQALADRFEDALALVRSGDIARVEQSFAA